MNDEQKQIAEKLIQILKEKGHEVVTELTKSGQLLESRRQAPAILYQRRRQSVLS